MKIDILCDSRNHPILPFLEDWVSKISNDDKKNIKLFFNKDDLKGGDFLFLISCNQIINSQIRDLYINTLVIHASDLPQGRGWSPLIWQILEGKNDIVISLFKAEDKIDSGDIYKKEILKLDGTEIYDEINTKLSQIILNFIVWGINNIDSSFKPISQNHEKATYYKKRSPNDSQLDINDSIKNQFNLLRVCDPNRYPAFFYHKGHKYEISIKSVKND